MDKNEIYRQFRAALPRGLSCYTGVIFDPPEHGIAVLLEEPRKEDITFVSFEALAQCSSPTAMMKLVHDSIDGFRFKGIGAGKAVQAPLDARETAKNILSRSLTEAPDAR